MKKKSRFLTGLLSAVMALSLFALPAAAVGEPGSEVTVNKTTSVIDEKKSGSITIYKYLHSEELVVRMVRAKFRLRQLIRSRCKAQGLLFTR